MTVRFKPINEVDGRTSEAKELKVQEEDKAKTERPKRIKFLITHPIGINGVTYYGEYYVGQNIHMPGGRIIVIDQDFMMNLLSRNAEAATAEAKIFKTGGVSMSVGEDGSIKTVDTSR
jgi:hypothetical protein